jgi:hypothetical protein
VGWAYIAEVKGYITGHMVENISSLLVAFTPRMAMEVDFVVMDASQTEVLSLCCVATPIFLKALQQSLRYATNRTARRIHTATSSTSTMFDA